MNSDPQEAFKSLFRENLQLFLTQGLPKNEAVAKALLKTKSEISKPPEPSPVVSLPTLSSTSLSSLIESCQSTSDYSSIVKLVASVYSSIDCLEQNFQPNESIHPTSENLSIDIEEVSNVYRLLFSLSRPEISNAILNAFEILSHQLSVGKPCLKSILVILEHPNIMDPIFCRILSVVLRNLDSLPDPTKEAVLNWLRTEAGEPRFVRYINILQQFTTVRVFEGSIDDARLAAKVLSLLHSTLPSHPAVSFEAFYNDAINSDYMESRENRFSEYRAWIADQRRRRPQQNRSLISYPFLLSPATKASILELDTTIQMRQEMDQQIEMAVARGQRFVIPYLVLRVSRENIVLDTLSQLMHYEHDSDFKRPLKIVFDDEEGVDAGGVRKEFFQIMTRRLLDPSYGMFKSHSESRLLWFNSDSLESDMEFELIGLLLGIAIYNSIIIDLPMPLAVYKKLKGQSCTLQDLETLEPTVGRGLRSLLTHEGDVSEMGFVFQLTYEIFDVMRTIDLKEGGGDIPVTNENREEYVNLYVKYLLEDAVVSQFSAFRRGFHKVCGGAALDLFQPSELQLLICGNPTLDFHDLELGTRYEDGYDSSSPTILKLWAVLHEFNEKQKRQFLKFVSGSDCSPIDGLSKLGFVVSKNGTDDSRLPSSHTCFNHFLLPEYSTQEVMKEKILFSIQETEGFGLR